MGLRVFIITRAEWNKWNNLNRNQQTFHRTQQFPVPGRTCFRKLIWSIMQWLTTQACPFHKEIFLPLSDANPWGQAAGLQLAKANNFSMYPNPIQYILPLAAQVSLEHRMEKSRVLENMSTIKKQRRGYHLWNVSLGLVEQIMGANKKIQ